MTDTQKKIQKSSKVLSVVFLVFVCACVLHGLKVLLSVLWLLINRPGAMEYFSVRLPYAGYWELFLHQLVYVLTWAAYAAAFIPVYQIFRDISREYTPFRSLHVRRLRWSAVLLAAVYTLELGLGAINSVLAGGTLSFTLALDPFLLPLAMAGLSFILDYACQLQTEADTTL